MEFTQVNLIRSYQPPLHEKKCLIRADIARKLIYGKHLLFNKALKYPGVTLKAKESQH